VNRNRPVNLDLTKFHFPLPAITSILFRISGVIIFVMLGVLLYLLDSSLESSESFARVEGWMDGFFVKFVVWGILSALLYHLVSGIKHLIQDMGYMETMEGATIGAKVSIAISIILIVLAGVVVW
tara:strand:- start:26249 stop:26623 length:375 start_codon:yes stop_codon:yes gene_type:complete